MSLYVPVHVKYICINEIWDFHSVDVEDSQPLKVKSLPSFQMSRSVNPAVWFNILED